MTTILVVDDHPLNLELMTEVLESSGYEVKQAGSAEAALAAVSTSRPDLILMDIALPGMDGHSAVRLLKSDPETRAIPVVAVTSFAMAGDEAQAYASGFDGYLSKPIQTRTLRQTVSRFLEQPAS
jgi:CheY-like chemotaxis protein